MGCTREQAGLMHGSELATLLGSLRCPPTPWDMLGTANLAMHVLVVSIPPRGTRIMRIWNQVIMRNGEFQLGIGSRRL